MTIAELIAEIAKKRPGGGNRTELHDGSSGHNEARFSCSVSWLQCFGLDSSKGAAGEALHREDNCDGRQCRIADLERVSMARSRLVSRTRSDSRRRQRLDSTASTEVDWMAYTATEKQLIKRTCENCCWKRLEPRDLSHRHIDGLTTRRRHSH